MESYPDKQDEQWLSAIAGRPDPEADALLNQQAASLRRVLLLQTAEAEGKISISDDRVYQRILDQLQQKPSAAQTASQGDSGLFKSLLRWLGASQTNPLPGLVTKNSEGGSYFFQPRCFALAASVVLAVVVVVRGDLLNRPSEDESMVFRGGEADIVQVVDDPRARLEELNRDLEGFGVKVRVADSGTDASSSKIMIEVPNTPEVRVYLEDQGFMPDPNRKAFIIVLKKNTSAVKQ
jgi:hypothetical protein